MLSCFICKNSDVKFRCKIDNTVFFCSTECQNRFNSKPTPPKSVYKDKFDCSDDSDDNSDISVDVSLIDRFFNIIITLNFDVASLKTLRNLILLYLTNFDMTVFYILYSMSYLSYSRLILRKRLNVDDKSWLTKNITRYPIKTKLFCKVVQHYYILPITVCLFNSLFHNFRWVYFIIPLCIEYKIDNVLNNYRFINRLILYRNFRDNFMSLIIPFFVFNQWYSSVLLINMFTLLNYMCSLSYYL